MCGITGILQIPRIFQSADLAVIGQMTARLRHRGPDADGSWYDRDAGIALGHRRLAIVDLTDAGRQPMTSRSGRFVITFNGEIYNYLSLRQELERCGQAFIGSGDTEVLLAMIERWGLETALRRSNGCSPSACGIARPVLSIWPATGWERSPFTSLGRDMPWPLLPS